MDRIIGTLKSRRFYAAIAAAALTPILETLGFDEGTRVAVVGVVVGWIVGESISQSKG
jgi:hypothetical protein